MIEAESQAVLNTLTEHDFQDAYARKRKHQFRKWMAPSSIALQVTRIHTNPLNTLR
jgi:hypothetical protein